MVDSSSRQGWRRGMAGIAEKHQRLVYLALLVLFAVLVVHMPEWVGNRDEKCGYSAEGEALGIRLAGIRPGGGDTIYSPGGRKVETLENYAIPPSWLSSVFHEFLLEVPVPESPNAIKFMLDAAVRYLPEGSSYVDLAPQQGRMILKGDKPMLAIPFSGPRRTIKKTFLRFFKIETDMRKVDLVLRYYPVEPLGALCVFEGPFAPQDVRESSDKRIRLEVGKGDRENSIRFRLTGASPKIIKDVALLFYDTSGACRQASGGASSRSPGESGSVFDLQFSLYSIPLDQVSRISVGEEPREIVFHNITLPEKGQRGAAYPPWMKKMARRLKRDPDMKLLDERFSGNPEDALKVVDVARGYSARLAVEALLWPRKEFQEFPKGGRARLRRAADAWLRCEDIEMRGLAIEVGLRLGWDGYFRRTLDLLAQTQKGSGLWGLRRAAGYETWVLGYPGMAQAPVDARKWFSFLAQYPGTLTKEEMEGLRDLLLSVKGIPQPSELVGRLKDMRNGPAHLPVLLDLVRHPQPDVWWDAANFLAPRMKPQEKAQLPREMQVRLFLSHGGDPQDPLARDKDVQKVCRDALLQTTEVPDSYLAGPLLHVMSRLCDRDSATSTILAFLGKKRNPRSDKRILLENMVKQINEWHDVNIGRLGRPTLFQQNPACDAMNWDQIVSDALEWGRTGRDPGALPEGYSPRPGDLRVVWRNQDYPEQSWIDVWRREQLDAPAHKQTMWVRDKTEGYSRTGDYLVYGIGLSRKQGDGAAEVNYQVEMLCGTKGACRPCSAAVPCSSLPAAVPITPKYAFPLQYPYKWQVWLERADSRESVIANAAVFRAWRQDPRKGLRFPERRVVTVRFPEDQAIGDIFDTWTNNRQEARGAMQVPMNSNVHLRFQQQLPRDLGFLEPLKDLEGILHITLYATDITDQDLAAFGDLGSLNLLCLSGCMKITDEGLAHLGNLNKLETLELQKTSVTGAGLRYLLGGAKVEGAGDPGPADCPARSLRSLVLRNSPVTDDNLASLENMRNLGSLLSLDLSGTRVHGKGLGRLAQLPALQSLQLENCGDLKDEDLAAFVTERFPALIVLSLRGCAGITDAGLERLKGFRQLLQLNLRDTSVTKAGCEALRAALPACSIQADPAR